MPNQDTITIDQHCDVCRKSLPLDYFHKNKTKLLGHSSTCKQCRSEYSKKHYLSKTDYYIKKASESKKANPARCKVHQIKNRALKSGLDFDLTTDWMRAKLAEPCPVTGLDFDRGGKRVPNSPEVDRIIPRLGYTMKNCRIVCRFYNLAKSDNSDSETLRLMKLCITGLENKP